MIGVGDPFVDQYVVLCFTYTQLFTVSLILVPRSYEATAERIEQIPYTPHRR